MLTDRGSTPPRNQRPRDRYVGRCGPSPAPGRGDCADSALIQANCPAHDRGVARGHAAANTVADPFATGQDRPARRRDLDRAVHPRELARRGVHQLALVRLGRLPPGLQHRSSGPGSCCSSSSASSWRSVSAPTSSIAYARPSAVSAAVGRAAEPRAVPGRPRAAQATAARRPARHRRRSRPAWPRRATGRSGSSGCNGGSFGDQGPAVPPRHLVLRLGLPGLSHDAQLRLRAGHLLADLLGRGLLHLRRDPDPDAGPEDHPVGASAPDRSHLRVHRVQGDRLLARPVRPGLFQPRQHDRRVLRRCQRGAAGQDDPVLDRDHHRDPGDRQPVAQERPAARHRVHRAADPEHRHQRHLPGDRPAVHGQAERQPEGSALHQPQHRRDPHGVRHSGRRPHRAARSTTRTTTSRRHRRPPPW